MSVKHRVHRRGVCFGKVCSKKKNENKKQNKASRKYKTSPQIIKAIANSMKQNPYRKPNSRSDSEFTRVRNWTSSSASLIQLLNNVTSFFKIHLNVVP